MYQTIKSFLTIFALVGVLAACSSNSSQDDAATTPTTGGDTSTNDSPQVGSTLDGVDTIFYFEFDKSNLSDAARAALTIHAEVLRSQPTAVRLEGHADERGTREYNLALGERRANEVKDFLVLQGVDASLLETVSYGEEQPAEAGSDEAVWSKNRRVELKK